MAFCRFTVATAADDDDPISVFPLDDVVEDADGDAGCTNVGALDLIDGCSCC